MQENTNKAIVINAIALYTKMALVTICSLLTTRFALQALGVVDFGLYSVLGGIISFINVFNTIMLTSSNRFISVAIGKGITTEINRTFNVLLVVFLIIACVTLVVSYPIGRWYVNNYVQYNGDITNAQKVFGISLIGAVISSLGTPYNGVLMAKERFVVFSIVDIITHIIRMVIVYLLISYFEHKLIIYTITIASLTALPTLIYWFYCNHKYKEIVQWRFVSNVKCYKEVLSFSGWVGYGAVAHIAKAQGAALIVNNFFNTAMNAALGLANSINVYITMFANTIAQPMAPQITKSYAAGNMGRSCELLILSTKFSFMLMLLMGSPFIVSCEWILGLWLGEVPAYAVSFTILLVIDNIVLSFNSGISNLIFASGKIKLYQILINSLRLLAIVFGYFALKYGHKPELLFLVYILFSIIIVLTTQWVLHKTLQFDNKILFKHSYLPSLIILLLFSPVVFLKAILNPLLLMLLAISYLLLLEFTIGLTKSEKNKLLKRVFKHKTISKNN